MAKRGPTLALDLATTSGWACGYLPPRPLLPMEWRGLAPPQSGTLRFGMPGQRIGGFLADAEDQLNRLIDRFAPAGLMVECTVLPAATNIDTLRRLNGLYGIALKLGFQRRIGWVREGQPSAVKKAFCGSGARGKDGVLAECLARGWPVIDDNQADALALWCHAAELFHAETRHTETRHTENRGHAS